MKRKVVLGMAVFMTAIMVPAQAFAAKPTGGGDYLSGTQEACLLYTSPSPRDS